MVDVRRVVTGHDEAGKAVFASDERVQPISHALLGGVEFHHLWGGDATPHFPDAGALPAHTTYFPAVGGFRFGLFTLPAGDPEGLPADLDLAQAVADLNERLPGLTSYMEPDNPGMHTTSTIDFEVVLAGTVTLELDDGATVELEPGDTVVQNGTRHRWTNHGDTPATLAVFIVGAEHDKVG
jgi:mannose-6-phosphate isomerase-like protein (cupin superfamily)